jgi:DNA-binding transcriptional MerR regulator
MKPSAEVVLYSTAEVSKISGASLRQLQWWDERRIFTPKRVKSRRRMYSQAEVLAVMLWVQMRQKGIMRTARRNALKAVAKDKEATWLVIHRSSCITCSSASIALGWALQTHGAVSVFKLPTVSDLQKS